MIPITWQQCRRSGHGDGILSGWYSKPALKIDYDTELGPLKKCFLLRVMAALTLTLPTLLSTAALSSELKIEPQVLPILPTNIIKWPNWTFQLIVS